MKLRRPTETLAGCMWLPRFIDKARHHHAGSLLPEYAGAFCNPLGVDGIFLQHFGLRNEDILDVIRRATGDDEVATWFASRPASSPDKIAAWNTIAPNIGRAGYPGERIFRWALKHVYPGCTDTRVNTVFLAIAWDEGFLDEACR